MVSFFAAISLLHVAHGVVFYALMWISSTDDSGNWKRIMKFVAGRAGMVVIDMRRTAGHRAQEETPPDQGALTGRRISWEQVDAYLEDMKARGCTPDTIKSYRRNLTRFYRALPPDKSLDRKAVENWRDAMLAHGYMPRTVNNRLSSANGFLEYLGLREYQSLRQVKPDEDQVQPELTRNEYLRLLSAARALGKERTYLLTKVFAVVGLAVQELPSLDVEAVRNGRVTLAANRPDRLRHIPDCLREELAAYIRREGITSGPVFVTRSGRPINRTSVTGCIQQLARDARVAPEKCNPRCLRKLCQSTREGIQQNMTLLAEQTLERLLEQEQLAIGWEEVNGHVQ